MRIKCYFITIMAMLNIFLVCAQPISLTYSTNGIEPGDVYNYYFLKIENFQPGKGGSDVIWNFSKINFGTEIHSLNYVKAPWKTLFSQATCSLCYGIDSIFCDFYKSDSTGIYYLGYFLSPYDLRFEKDKKSLLIFPFSYDSSFYSKYWGVIPAFGANYHTLYNYGQTSIKCDGWGSLIINGHNYNNVLRIQSIDTNNELELTIGGEEYNKSYSLTESYLWYSITNKFAILNYTIVKDLSGKTISEYIQFNHDATGINSNKKFENIITFYPNPCYDFINLEFNFTGPQKINIELTNTNGQVVYSEVNSLKTGRYTKKLDVSDFPKGIYTIRLFNNESFVVKKLIIQ